MDCKIQSSNDKCVFRYGQANVQQLLPAFDRDCCRACGNQTVEHSSETETVFSSSQKLGRAAEHLIAGNKKKNICRFSFEL